MSVSSGSPAPKEVDIALARSRDNRVLAGVCGGIAEWLGWDPTLVRILYVLLSVISAAFPGIIVYLVLWVVMPEE
jgi:phage shock protein PspC (stress-responsive transcriptional regulator)